MDIITKFLQENFFQNQKINAPTMAYLAVYGEMPNPPIWGREASHKTYNYNNISRKTSLFRGEDELLRIDKHIPKKCLDKLNSINEIELTASCEGDSERHLTFLIFRNLDRSKKTAEKIVQNLNKQKNIKALTNIGTAGFPRICISSKLWYSKDNEKEFLTWWNNLPNIIENCVGRI